MKNNKQNRSRNEKRDILITRLGGQCHSCGLIHDGENGYLFDFHHVDEKQKKYQLNITNMNRSLVNLYEEADKCMIYCANCHRTLHHKKAQ